MEFVFGSLVLCVVPDIRRLVLSDIRRLVLSDMRRLILSDMRRLAFSYLRRLILPYLRNLYVVGYEATVLSDMKRQCVLLDIRRRPFLQFVEHSFLVQL